jgi:AGZA family xanthine/uracil permease-like MFS transporter
MHVPWQVALGAVAVAGAMTTIFVGVRTQLMLAIPSSLKHAIAVGIGLLIAMVGLQWSGIIVRAPGTMVGLGTLKSPPTLLAMFGLLVMAALQARGVRGALLAGILVSTLVGWTAGLVRYEGVIAAPPSLRPTWLQLDIPGALAPQMVAIIFVFFFLDLFDSVGTLVGVAEQGGLMRGGVLPRARTALLTDALGTIGGAALGTSTITSYIESATGVAAGGRTGLANVITGTLFLLSVFALPLVKMVGGGYPVGESGTLYPIVAPALVLVGAMMIRSVTQISWQDATEAIPAFLTMLLMPLTVSITEGIAFGFVAYSFLKVSTGRGREAGALVHIFAVLFVLRYAFLR